jgi:hypothetical protein
LQLTEKLKKKKNIYIYIYKRRNHFEHVISDALLMNLSLSMHMMTDGTMWWQCSLNQLRGQAAVVKKLNGLPMAYRESVVVTLTSCYSPEKFTRGKN